MPVLRGLILRFLLHSLSGNSLYLIIYLKYILITGEVPSIQMFNFLFQYKDQRISLRVESTDIPYYVIPCYVIPRVQSASLIPINLKLEIRAKG